MIYELKKRKQETFLALHFDGSPKSKKELLKFGIDADQYYLDNWIGYWLIVNKDAPTKNIQILSHDDMWNEYVCKHPESLTVKQTMELIPQKKKEEMIKSLGVRPAPLYITDHDDEVEESYDEVSYKNPPIKAGDGQFTGGFYQEEYSFNGKLYVFDFDSGSPVELAIYPIE